MEPRMMWGRGAFCIGLLLMIASGLVSAPIWSLHGQGLTLIALIGALATTAGGLIHARAVRLCRRHTQGQFSRPARPAVTTPLRNRRVA